MGTRGISFTVRCLIMFTLLWISSAQLYSNMTRLKYLLLKDYQPSILPREDNNHIVVNMSTEIYYNSGTDELRGTATFQIAIRAYWTDVKLKWDPKDFDGIDEVAFYQKEIWTPRLFLSATVAMSRANEPDGLVAVSYNGTVSMFSPQTVELICIFAMRYWPFDKSLCFAGAMVEHYKYKDVQLQIIPMEEKDILMVNKNAKWYFSLLDYDTVIDMGSSTALYCLTLERNPAFAIASIITPMISMMIMGAFVFLLPIESGERISFSLTLMLALAVFLTIIADDIPKVSDPVPLICIYMLAGIGISILNTLFLIYSMRIYHRNKKTQIGPLFRSLVNVSRLKGTKQKQKSKDITIIEQHRGVEIRNITEGKRVHCANRDAIDGKGECENHHNQTVDDTYTSTGRERLVECCSWQEVSKAIDAISFVVSFTLTLVGAVVAMVHLRAAASTDESYYELCWVKQTD